jgi:hypothetical protein
MNHLSRSILALILPFAAATASAAPQEVAPAGYAQASQQYMAGHGGDAKARDAAIEAFHAMAAAMPGHPVLKAYEGSGIAMQARDAMMPWNKMTLAEKGANALEKAVAQLTPAHDEFLFGGVPESIEVRMIAASTLLALPDIMSRGPMGKRILEAAIASPVFAQSPAPVRVRLLQTAANLAGKEKRKADEKDLLVQVLAIAPQTVHAKQAETRIKELAQ